MQITLCEQLKQFLRVMQGSLFPVLEEQLGPLTGKLRQLVSVLNLVPIDGMLGCWQGRVGRPPADCRAMARAIVANAVYNMSDT